MDEVQAFIARNQHQLGYIMHEASRQWIENDPVGAFTVGECNLFIQKHGQYHELLKKVGRYEKALKRISFCDFEGWSGSDVLGKVTDFANKTLKD